MADEEKIETNEQEAPEAEDVSDAEVSDTVPAAEAEAAEPEPEPEAAEAEAEAEAPEPEAEAPEPEPEPEPAAPAKKQRSLKHVPRTARRTRTKVVAREAEDAQADHAHRQA